MKPTLILTNSSSMLESCIQCNVKVDCAECNETEWDMAPENYTYTNYVDGYYSNSNVIIGILTTFGFILLVGIVGNGLVLYVVLKNGTMRTVTNLYLVNLAVADLMLLIYCVPYIAVHYLLTSWPFGQLMCKCWSYLTLVSLSVNVMTMTALAVDRYYAIVRPLRSRIFRTIRRTITILSVIWISSFIGLLPTVFIKRTVRYWDEGTWTEYCVEHWKTANHRTMFTVMLFVAFYLTPLFVISSAYLLMAKNLWTSIGPSGHHSPNIYQLSRTKTTKLLLVVVLVFAVCWLPTHCVQLSYDTGTWSFTDTTYVVKLMGHTLQFCNSAINPFIYAFLSETFRESFKDVFIRSRNSKTKVFVITDVN